MLLNQLLVPIHCQILKTIIHNEIHPGHIDNKSTVTVGERVHAETPAEITRTGKRKRARTGAAQASAHLIKYNLLPSCSIHCRRKCHEKISDDHRQNRTFWSYSFGEKRLWLDGHISILQVKRRRGDTTESDLRRNKSLQFKLPLPDGWRITVCKTMLIHTLGLKTDGIITEFVRAKNTRPEDANGINSGTRSSHTVTADNRGKAAATDKKDHDAIRQHINSYHAQVSHYTRDRAPNRRYLESHLSISSMWKDYQAKQGTTATNSVSYDIYRKVFDSERITFGEPPQDECEVCAEFKVHCQEKVPDHNGESSQICVAAKRHLERARLSRQAYGMPKPADNNEYVFAVDMQKVILLPKMTIKEHFFVS